jgi:hypothetical protein
VCVCVCVCVTQTAKSKHLQQGVLNGQTSRYQGISVLGTPASHVVKEEGGCHVL